MFASYPKLRDFKIFTFSENPSTSDDQHSYYNDQIKSYCCCFLNIQTILSFIVCNNKLVGVIRREIFNAQVAVFLNLIKKSLKKIHQKNQWKHFFEMFSSIIQITSPFGKGSTWPNFDTFISQPTKALPLTKKIGWILKVFSVLEVLAHIFLCLCCTLFTMMKYYMM